VRAVPIHAALRETIAGLVKVSGGGAGQAGLSRRHLIETIFAFF
jgi:hypothetical protein